MYYSLRCHGTRATISSSPSVPFVFQILLHFQSGHAAGTCGSDGLTVAAVLHVAAREYARHSREDVLLRNQVAIRIGFELAFEDLGVRDVANTKKHCARREFPAFAALQIAQTQGGDFLFAYVENVIHDGIGEKRD